MNSEAQELPEQKEFSATRHKPGSYAEIMAIAWPMILSMISYTVMSFTDIMFISWLGSTETAAVVFGNIVTFQIFSLGTGFLGAVRTIVAQDYGAGRIARIRDDLGTGLAYGIIIGSLLASIAFFREPLLNMLAGTETQATLSAPYVMYRMAAFPFVCIRFTVDSYFGALSDTRTPMVINIVSNLTNIFLTYALVFGFAFFPAMGIVGAGLSTFSSEALSALLSLIALRIRPISWRILSEGKVLPTLEGFRRLYKVGMPIAVQFFLEIGSFNFVNILISHVGDKALAASGIALQYIFAAFMPANGIGSAASILVGQYQGAKRTDIAMLAVRRAIYIVVMLMGSFSITFILIPEPLMALFSSDYEVVFIGIGILYIAAFFQVIDGLGVVFYSALQGAGDTFWPMVVGVGGGWLIMVPTSWLFIQVFEWGAYGGWIAKAMHLIVFGLLVTYRYRVGKWKTMEP